MTTEDDKPGSTKREPTFKRVGENLYRHSPSGGYYGLIKRSGKQFRRSLKTQDRELAVRRLRALREKVGKLIVESGSKWVTFAEVAGKWFEVKRLSLKEASAARRETSLRQLIPTFGNTPVRNITKGACDAWMVRRSKEGVAAQTMNHDRETLVQILEYAISQGLLMENPAGHLPRRKVGKSKLLIPTRDEFAQLVRTLNTLDARARHAVDLVELLAYSGMRLGEAVSLRWEDIDRSRDLFTVTGGETGTKNHEARGVPLFPSLGKLLERIQSRCNETTGRVIKIESAKKSMITACEKAGLPNFTHHSMRHFFVSNAIEAGVDFKVIASWVGHKDGGVLVAKTYGHLRDTHSFDMAKRMDFSC